MIKVMASVSVIRTKMNKQKILLNVSRIEDLERYKTLGIEHFLFPLKGYSIGYEEFDLKEIEDSKVKAYLLINRILDDDDIDRFLELSLPSNVLGLVIEDIGLYYALKNRGYKLILFQNHLNNNSLTINFWLEYFDSLMISTDITLKEIEKILSQTKKPLVLNVLSYPMIMYSRRHLVTNYCIEHDISEKKALDIVESKDSLSLKLIESPYGTAVFDDNLFDMREEALTLNAENIKFYFVDTHFLKVGDVISLLNNIDEILGIKGFLYKKTVYKIGDLK